MLALKIPGAVGSFWWGRGEYHAQSVDQSIMPKDPSPDIEILLVIGTPPQVPPFRMRTSRIRTGLYRPSSFWLALSLSLTNTWLEFQSTPAPMVIWVSAKDVIGCQTDTLLLVMKLRVAGLMFKETSALSLPFVLSSRFRNLLS